MDQPRRACVQTDTASVLHETIEYIKFLHDQVGVSAPSSGNILFYPSPFNHIHVEINNIGPCSDPSIQCNTQLATALIIALINISLKHFFLHKCSLLIYICMYNFLKHILQTCSARIHSALHYNIFKHCSYIYSVLMYVLCVFIYAGTQCSLPKEQATSAPLEGTIYIQAKPCSASSHILHTI